MKNRRLKLWMTAAVSAGILACSFGTGAAAEETVSSAEAAVSEAEEAGSEDATDADLEAANKVAALIDAIYVQSRTDETDAQIEAARAGWDALTDVQKELVAGEEADPDYFGRDTGDASLDDPLNEDGIGEKELLVVSFGTSYNDSRTEDIGGIEKALQEAFPDWSVRRAFTSQIILNHIQARDGEKIDNVDQALERAVANGVRHLVVQPTHLMQGAEYDELCASIEAYRSQFESVYIAKPLLGDVGADASEVNEDKKTVAEAAVKAAADANSYDSPEAMMEDGIALVLLGHGTSHTAAVTYSQMQAQVGELNYPNVFIGTVEGKPDGTGCEDVIDRIAKSGYRKVFIRPLMVVAGDHANNDMADPADPESWISRFSASGNFDSVVTQIAGLGRLPEVQAVYVAHAGEYIEEAAEEAAAPEADAAASENAVPEDGTYLVDVTTDSSMFHVNEADEGKGILTVEGGSMSVYFRLPSTSVQNLFAGTAEEAQQEGAQLLEPQTDTVTYDDGISEEVNGFTVPVPALDEEFPVALIGTKGKWYDHMISVSNPEHYEG